MATNEIISRRRQVVYIISPFFLLLFGLIALNIITYEAEIEEVAVLPTAVLPTPIAQQIATATITSSPTSAATPVPPTATPYTPPSYEEQTAVTLLGPPSETIFRLQDSVIFYWTWPHLLSDDQQLTLYIQHDGQATAVASLNEPNLGTTYRITLPLDELVEETAVIQWQIRLESTFADTPLTTSDIRTITILP